LLKAKAKDLTFKAKAKDSKFVLEDSSRPRTKAKDNNTALNDLVARAFASAGVPVTKEPHGLTRSDGKCPDGLTMVPWKEGKPLTWDVTVVCSLADSSWMPQPGMPARRRNQQPSVRLLNILPWRGHISFSPSLLNL